MSVPVEHPNGPLRELLRGLPVFSAELPVFRTDEAPDDPVALFVQWLVSAVDAAVSEPHVAVLSTVDERGRAAGRALICKDVDVSGA